MRASGNSARSAAVRARGQGAPLIITRRVPVTGGMPWRCACSSISSSWLGTATRLPARPRCSVSSAAAAENWRCRRMPAPVHRPSSAPNRNSECESRPGTSTVVPVAGPKLCTQISKLWVHDPCVRRKPLGTPVLPEVKPM